MAPREDKEKAGITKTIYHARVGRSETNGKLDLEIVAVTANDNTFTILFAGAPLPKAEVTVAGPPRWKKRLTADDQGRIAVPTPWTGCYVLEVGSLTRSRAPAAMKNSPARAISHRYRSCTRTVSMERQQTLADKQVNHHS